MKWWRFRRDGRTFSGTSSPIGSPVSWETSSLVSVLGPLQPSDKQFKKKNIKLTEQKKEKGWKVTLRWPMMASRLSALEIRWLWMSICSTWAFSLFLFFHFFFYLLRLVVTHFRLRGWFHSIFVNWKYSVLFDALKAKSKLTTSIQSTWFSSINTNRFDNCTINFTWFASISNFQLISIPNDV